MMGSKMVLMGVALLRQLCDSTVAQTVPGPFA